MNFQLINLRRGANPQHFTGIVRREIAAAIILKPLAHLTARFPNNARPNRITIAGDAFQLKTQPAIALGRVIF